MKKVAIWGIGKHAEHNLIPSLIASEGIHLTGCYTRNMAKSEIISERFGIMAFNSEEELLESPEVDTIVLSTPSGLHDSQSRLILESGKSVWSEKPLILSDELMSWFSRENFPGYKIGEMFMFLYHSQFSLLEELLQSRKIGNLVSMSCKFGIPHLGMDNVRYRKDLGGGAFFDTGCYPVAAAHALIGPEPEHVFSRIYHEDGFSVDTNGFAQLTYPGGIRANLEWGFGLSYRNEITLWGSDGWLRVDRAFSKNQELESSIVFKNSAGSREEFSIPSANHFVSMFEKNLDRTSGDWVKEQSNMMKMISSCANQHLE